MAGNSRSIKRDAAGDVAPQIFDEVADEYQYAVGTDGKQHAIIYTPDNQPVDFGAADIRGLLADRPDPATVRPGTTYWAVDRIGEADEFTVSKLSAWEPYLIIEGGGSSGDMLKSEYDSDGDGIVNAADSVPWTGITGKPAFGSAATTESSAYATAAQGTKADTAVQPAAIADFVSGDGITNIVALTQAEYDGLTPDSSSLYVITDA